ncbi:MAG: glycosyltransferase family 4 protein [Candidatus Margulisiibacteriota bacterium]
MPKIALLVDSPLSNNMAGPMLRYYELARVLAKKHQVTLAGEYVEPGFAPPPQVEVLNIPAFHRLNVLIKASLPNPSFLKELNRFDAVITHGRILRALGLSKIKAKLIIDLYGPWFIEDLVTGKSVNLKGINELLLKGDHFICAHERQKDLYLGLMLAAGRKAADLDKKIGLVPVGISSVPPQKGKRPLPEGFMVVSWGGMWDWLDNRTLVKALSLVGRERKDIKLLFFGANTKAAREIPRSENVLLIDQWIPYAERGNWLAWADLGVVSHFDNLETHFAWRTRALDLLWANLPIVTSSGDAVSAVIKEKNLGRVVACGDAEAFAKNILELAENAAEREKIRQNIGDFIPALYWENLTGPIDDFCK